MFEMRNLFHSVVAIMIIYWMIKVRCDFCMMQAAHATKGAYEQSYSG